MRYGIGIIVIVFLVIVGIIVLAGHTGTGTPTVGSRFTSIAKHDSSDTALVSWTIQGRLLGEDQRRSIRITVGQNQRTVEVLDGYEGNVERSETLDSTPAAFQSFTRALDLLNFGKERDVKVADDRGVCPLGNVFIYRLTDGGKEVMRTWSDSCGTSDGPFAGTSAATIQQLFKNQISNYNQFVQNVIL